MKMSANENDSVNRRFNLVDLEELNNRMERPSRVFSSRHHISIPSVLPDTNNMDQHEPFRRSRDNSFLETINNSTRNTGLIGDTGRNRSPFVRFTITDPETRQITAAGQIPLDGPHHHTHTMSNSVADVPINDESEDESFHELFSSRFYSEQRQNFFDHLTTASVQARLARNAARRRRFTEHPYFTRNNLESSSFNSRTSGRRVRFSPINQDYNNHPPDRSQTPEQQLPEGLENLLDTPEIAEDEFETVYQDIESMSSISSPNHDADSGDDGRSINFSVSETHNSTGEEENTDNLDIANETPRTRVVPFNMSPIPSSPPTVPPSDTSDIPALSLNNNLPVPVLTNVYDFNTSALHPFSDSQYRYVLRYDSLSSGSINSLFHVEQLDIETDIPYVNNLANQTIHPMNNDSRLVSRSPRIANAPQSHDQSRVTEGTSALRDEEHPETYEDLNDQITRLYECPVCFEHIVPPIFQCLLGHLICNKCVTMCENCPTCRNPFNSKRNLYMEKVGYLVKFPCRNVITGCKEHMFIGQKEIHEQECSFRYYPCFFNNCTWKGYNADVPEHMSYHHRSRVLDGPIHPIDFFLPSCPQSIFKWCLMAHQECFSVIAYTCVPPRRVKLQVNLIGPAAKAKKFKYTVIIDQDSSDTIQKITYERETLPYAEVFELNNIHQRKNIFSLPGDIILPFIKKKRRRLPIILTVDRVSDTS